MVQVENEDKPARNVFPDRNMLPLRSAGRWHLLQLEPCPCQSTSNMSNVPSRVGRRLHCKAGAVRAPAGPPFLRGPPHKL